MWNKSKKEEPEYIGKKTAFQSMKSSMLTDCTEDSDNFNNEMSSISFTFTNLNNQPEQVSLGKYDPEREHLTVCHGLNLKGRCANQKCKAFNDQKVWIHKGYGTFDIADEKAGNKCSGCQQKISFRTVNSLGFTRAKVVFRGKIEGKDDYETFYRQMEEREGKLHYFKDSDADMVQYTKLTAEVTKL